MCVTTGPETRKQRTTRKWWETLCRNGKATVCPLCGEFTKSDTGFCWRCTRRHGLERKAARKEEQ